VLKKVAVGAVGLLAAAFVLPVLAQPSVDLTVDVDSVALAEVCTSEGGGDPFQTWEVALSVQVTNTADEVAHFDRTGYYVKFRTPAGASQIGYDVTVVDADRFQQGEEVAARGTGTYGPVVRVTIPCDATAADVFATLDLQGRDKTYVDGAPFLENGTPVPLGPTGALGIAAMVGAVGLLALRLGRKPRSIETASGRVG
jgi:hypothetical protein